MTDDIADRNDAEPTGTGEAVADSGDSPNPGQVDTAGTFRLDYEDLRARGFFSPDVKGDRLSLQLRAIKRRLLRRIGFSRRLDHGKVGKSVLVTSTRPAEGKTFTAVNIALSLATEDRVGAFIVDADAPRPRVLSHLGLSNGRKGFTDLLAEGETRLEDYLLKEEDGSLMVLPVGTQTEAQSDLFAGPEARALIKGLTRRYPNFVTIIDTPPVLATPDAVLLAPLVDEVIFVIEANSTPEPAVATALDELLDANENVSLVLNRCLVPAESAHYYSYDEYYARYRGGSKKEETS